MRPTSFVCAATAVCVLTAFPGLAAGPDFSATPKLHYRLVEGWPQLPRGWNFGECTGVDVDAQDHVWVFHRGKYPVMEFTPDGRLLQAWDGVPLVSAHGLRIDREGFVWLVDVDGHAVIKCDRTGRVRMVIANSSNRPGGQDAPYGFNRPTGLWFGPSGDFYVADGYVNARVIHYSRDGIYLGHWGSKGKGDGQFDLVHDVCLDLAGRVYVADRNNERIQVFDPEGRFLAAWTHVGSPWGLYYVAREEAIYMVDGKYNRLVKLALDGKVLGVYGEFGKIPGKFDFAHNVAVDSSGAVYVAEIKNWRVQKFVPVR